MPGPPSDQALPRWVDSRKFAQKGVELEGQIAAESLPRLARAASSVAAPAHARLRFGIDDSGHRTVTGPLYAKVTATCQRCMADTELEIASDLAVAMVGSDEEAKQLPKSLEPWVVDREEVEADLYAMVEDELLLDLPMVVYHDYQCIEEELYSAGSEEAPRESKPNPFQVLEQLKDRKK